MSIGLSQLGLGDDTFYRQPVLQMEGLEFKRHGYLPDKLMQMVANDFPCGIQDILGGYYLIHLKMKVFRIRIWAF